MGEGKTLAEIAETVGMSTNGLYTVFKNLGVTRPGPSPREKKYTREKLEPHVRASHNLKEFAKSLGVTHPKAGRLKELARSLGLDVSHITRSPYTTLQTEGETWERDAMAGDTGVASCGDEHQWGPAVPCHVSNGQALCVRSLWSST